MGDVVGGFFLGFGASILLVMWVLGWMGATLREIRDELERIRHSIWTRQQRDEYDAFGEHWHSGDEPWAETSED